MNHLVSIGTLLNVNKHTHVVEFIVFCINSGSVKSQCYGSSDNSSDDMKQFTRNSLTQQRYLIFQKLSAIECKDNKAIDNLTEDVK